MMSELPKCRKCGRIIKFIPTKNGKYMPVDSFSVWVQPYVRGAVYYTEDGGTLRGYLSEKGAPKAVQAYQSHFATCRHAEELRNPKPRSNKARESIRRIVEREKAAREAGAAKRAEKADREAEREEAQRAQCSIFGGGGVLWK